MKKRFVHTFSPITIIIALLLDIAVLGYTYFAFNKLRTQFDSTSVFFAVIVLFALLIASLVTKEVLKHGVIFRDNEAEFTAADNNNVIQYKDIEKIEFYKDNSASLTKNFNYRHAIVIITYKENKVISIDLGLITNSTLNKLAESFKNHTDGVEVKLSIVKKPFKNKTDND